MKALTQTENQPSIEEYYKQYVQTYCFKPTCPENCTAHWCPRSYRIREDKKKNCTESPSNANIFWEFGYEY